jgi:cyclase
VPLTIGGGVTQLSQCRDLLRAGADKVLINTAAYDNPSLIREASRAFGTQCVVAGVDVREGVCYAECGRRRTPLDPVAWSRKLEDLGAGEILLTSIERDGTMQGYAYDLIAQVSSAVGIPVIASGGAGSYSDMHAAILAGASAVAAASIFHFTEQTPLEAKRYLASQGIAVRLGL